MIGADARQKGYDLQYGTNVLGHAYLINECISLLKASATATGHKARVCITSSSAHHFMPSKIPDGIAWDTLEGADNAARKKMGKETLYAQSKLSNVILTQACVPRRHSTCTAADDVAQLSASICRLDHFCILQPWQSQV